MRNSRSPEPTRWSPPPTPRFGLPGTRLIPLERTPSTIETPTAAMKRRYDAQVRYPAQSPWPMEVAAAASTSRPITATKGPRGLQSRGKQPIPTQCYIPLLDVAPTHRRDHFGMDAAIRSTGIWSMEAWTGGRPGNSLTRQLCMLPSRVCVVYCEACPPIAVDNWDARRKQRNWCTTSWARRRSRPHQPSSRVFYAESDPSSHRHLTALPGETLKSASLRRPGRPHARGGTS